MSFLYYSIGVSNANGTEIKPENENIVRETIDGVEVKASNVKLYWILEMIQEHSGIEFKVSQKLTEERVTANIISDNWTSAVQNLLKYFNHLDIWNKDGSLQRVQIVGRFEGDVPKLQDNFSMQKIQPPQLPSELPPLPRN